MKPSPEIQSPESKRALTIRLRKVSGQLRSIEQMIADDRDCAEILNQLVSARRGLKSLSEAVIQGHLRHCIGEAPSNADAQHRLREILSVLERYVE